MSTDTPQDAAVDLAAITRPPATDALMKQIVEAVVDTRDHDHPERSEDFFCLNLYAWMGERMGTVLVRLRDTEAEAQRARQDAATWKRTTDQTAEALAEVNRERGEAQDELGLLRERIRQYADRIAHFGGHVEIAEDLRGLAADPMKVPDVI